jgi:hypothetical protein
MNLSRQSFLGKNSGEYLEEISVCIVGLGGGGSHLAQQLAHLGVGNFVLVDYDQIDDTNLNRLVGATSSDAKNSRYKVEVISKRIRAINPKARAIALKSHWQDAASSLCDCDVIFGCVDSFLARRDLDAAARRYLLPYIDIGMDVHELQDGFAIGGQVALSMPGSLCLRCMGIVTDGLINREAALYGAAGSRPQVVWTNGVLASTAVGVFVEMLLPWHKDRLDVTYLEYDANLHEVRPSLRIPFLPQKCVHFDSLNSIGDPFFEI